MEATLKITSKIRRNIPVLTLEGEIDVYTYPDLNHTLLDLIKEEKYTIVIDMEKVKYIDSTGLGVLANSANKTTHKNGLLKVVCTNPQLIKIFSVSGLTNKNLRIYKTIDAALKDKKS